MNRWMLLIVAFFMCMMHEGMLANVSDSSMPAMVRVPGCVVRSFQTLVESAGDALPKEYRDAYAEFMLYLQKNNYYAPKHVLHFTVSHSLFMLKLSSSHLFNVQLNNVAIGLENYRQFLASGTDETFCACAGMCSCPLPCPCADSGSKKEPDFCWPCTSDPYLCCW